MNNKERYIQKIIDIVVSCCATEIDEEGTMSITKEDVLGKSRARKNLESGMPNSGLTYSNMEEGKSVVVISRTTSADEFQNTFDHEKGHLAMHISQALGIDPFSEEFEYLTGETGRHLFKVAKNLLCEHCRGRVMSLPIRSKKLS